jgi:GDP-L-fucose synthase
VLNKEDRIFVAGHRGMVGSAIVRALQHKGYNRIITRDRSALDLCDQGAVRAFFKNEPVDVVVIAAAKVGGILANSTYPAEFIYQNLMIENNLVHEAFQAGVCRLLMLGSSCIYPQLASQPMTEEALLTGPLEPTNEPYAIAKIAGIKLCEAYNRQYGTSFAAVMPTNLYGPGDNFHPDNSHVLPAMIRRFHEAKQNDAEKVVVWGSGKPRREFLHVDDMADACLFVMELSGATLEQTLLSYPHPCFLNVGTGVDMSIRRLAETVKKIVGFRGALAFDPGKPDGTPQKLLDVSRMKTLGWQARISLHDGIAQTYQWFLDHRHRLRK